MKLDQLIARRWVRDLATVLFSIALIAGIGITMSAKGNDDRTFAGLLLCLAAAVVLAWISHREWLARRSL